MNKAYMYCRYSTQRQIASPELQIADCKKYFDWKLAGQVELFPEAFIDEAISGKTCFQDRPAGRKLDKILERGDHVLISKLDRGFRNPRDMLGVLECWKDRGIKLHLLDINADCSSPVGELIVTIMAAVARWERIRISERILAGCMLGKEKKLQRGLCPWIIPPIGFKWAGQRPNKYWKMDPIVRADMKLAVELYDKWIVDHSPDHTLNLIVWEFCRLRLKRLIKTKRFFNDKRGVVIAIKRERKLQAWEAEGRNPEWIAQAMLISRLKALGYAIPPAVYIRLKKFEQPTEIKCQVPTEVSA